MVIFAVEVLLFKLFLYILNYYCSVPLLFYLRGHGAFERRVRVYVPVCVWAWPWPWPRSEWERESAGRVRAGSVISRVSCENTAYQLFLGKL